MAHRLWHIWLAMIVALGQFLPLHASVVRASAASPPGEALCCMGACCCGDPAICPCFVAPMPEPANDQRPEAPAPTRDAEQCRAMLADLARLIAHPALVRAPIPAIPQERAEVRRESLTTQILHGVWRN